MTRRIAQERVDTIVRPLWTYAGACTFKGVSRRQFVKLTAAGAAAAVLPGTVEAGDVAAVATSPSYALYAAPDQQNYVRLDPNTLADLPHAAPLDFGERDADWVLSADGTVSAQLESSGEIVIRSGLTGLVRRTIQPMTRVFAQAISRDGSRLLTQIPMSCGPGLCSAPVWYVYDTTTGKLVSTVTGDDQGNGPVAFFDPAGRRLYRPTFDRGNRTVGPWPLQLVAYDLTNAEGREIGRLTLPTVLAGTWYDRVINQVPVAEVLTPGIALSPDGRTLAVVHADTDALTVIDADTLRVTRTVTLTKPTGLGERLLAWVGLAPQTAEAKFMDGISLNTVFAADGRTLYVFGTEGKVGATQTDVSERGVGLRAIDSATGTIVGQAFSNQEVGALPAPDGRAVYVSGSTGSTMAPYRLVRLDPRSLAVLASRDFAVGQSVIVVPLAP